MRISKVRGVTGYGKGQECESHVEMQRCRENLLNNRWPHNNEAIALREIPTVKNATE